MVQWSLYSALSRSFGKVHVYQQFISQRLLPCRESALYTWTGECTTSWSKVGLALLLWQIHVACIVMIFVKCPNSWLSWKKCADSAINKCMTRMIYTGTFDRSDSHDGLVFKHVKMYILRLKSAWSWKVPLKFLGNKCQKLFGIWHIHEFQLELLFKPKTLYNMTGMTARLKHV